MPIYEHHCLPCDLTFEALAPLSEARSAKRCPSCGRRAARVTSAFAIAGGAPPAENSSGAMVKQDPRPLCLRHPHLPLLCHMDEGSARRFVAHANGRGAEYDDRKAEREERRHRLGEPPAAAAPKSAGHGHEFRRHGHAHGHAHAHDGKHGHGHEHGHGVEGRARRGRVGA